MKMGNVSLLVLLLLLVYNWGVIDTKRAKDEGDERPARPSIWEIAVENEKNSSSLKGKGKYGSGDDASSGHVSGGDILVDPDAPNPASMRGSTAGGGAQQGEITAIPLFSWHQKIWQTREIPYLLEASVNVYRKVILAAIAQIRKNTGGCLKFRPKKPSGDKWWLEFYYGNGCFSGIGRKYWKEGPTKISIGLNCNWKDIVMHEMLHALGFPHEQSRTDRDKYVQIFFRNIISGMETNFEKSEITDSYYFRTPYDYQSIMHYTRKAFSRGGKTNTIIKKGASGKKLSGDVMSKWDKAELKRMYQCQSPDGWSSWIDTPCMCTSDREYCSKAKVRICFGTGTCSGQQQYGTQQNSKVCKVSEEGKFIGSGNYAGTAGGRRPSPVRKLVSENWSGYGACKAKCDCGWGFQERTRIGSSSDRQARLCRLERCPSRGRKLNADSNFNGGRWRRFRFDRKDSQSRGGYASARRKFALSYLSSPNLKKTRNRRCLMFQYKMSGTDGTLTVHMQIDDTKRSLSFKKSGNQGASWKRAAVTVPGSKSKSYKLVIKANRKGSKTSTILIDDIFVDNGACPSGLNVCRNVKSKSFCEGRGRAGNCNNRDFNKRKYMYNYCCGTCQEKRYRNKGRTCGDKNANCKIWAKDGDCRTNASYMLKSCCNSCRLYRRCRK